MFSVNDKLKIIKLLDELCIDYIEIGSPYASLIDKELICKLQHVNLQHSKPVVFGSTCRVGAAPGEDDSIKLLAECDINTCAIFGKAWDMHVKDILRTDNGENLRIIAESIKYLKERGKTVIFDAEHFYDGFKGNREYALKVIKTAGAAGADHVVLCDTNGGMFPDEIYEITKAAFSSVDAPIGVHTHNDGGMAVSNSIMAVYAGAVQVQGTIIGIGERCGNANLSTVMANLQLKRGYDFLPAERMKMLSGTARAVAEIANISIRNLPYVSKQAFWHKAGMHIDGVLKNPQSFEHIDPGLVGNERVFLMSDMAGKSAVMTAIKKLVPDMDKNAPEVTEVLNRLKELEFEGYQFDVADASLELVIRKALGLYKKCFEIDKCKVTNDYGKTGEYGHCSVMIKVFVEGKEELTAAEANGPVRALDVALRKALEKFYPGLRNIHLTDYKVRILNSEAATGAITRVLIETQEEGRSWTTIGVSADIIEASLKALIDSIEYKLQEAVEFYENDNHTKILAKKAGMAQVREGQLIQCDIDLCLSNDITAPVAIYEFEKAGFETVFSKSKIVFVLDHFTPTKDIKSAEQCKVVREFAKKHKIINFYEGGCAGVEHALLPELALAKPGMVIIGADSHTCTYGALGAFSTGMGSTDIAAGMATGRTWLKVPKAIAFKLTGSLKAGVTGKDLILYIIGKIGVDGARYMSMEFFGGGVSALSMDDRLTIANMAIEAGAKNGIFITDEVTRDYAISCGYDSYEETPEPDEEAYDEIFEIDLSEVGQMIAFPHLPSNVFDVKKAAEKNIKIDQVVIGSCTNGRLADMKAAADILRGKKVADDVRCIIIPATPKVYMDCLSLGYIKDFMEAGAIVSPPTCGPCLGGHMGILAKGEKALATTNRNFVGRMGHAESEVYLASPIVAAKGAISGLSGNKYIDFQIRG